MKKVLSRNEAYAWAAGFIDGEGCFHVKKSKSGSRIALKVTQNHRQPLDRLKALMGGCVWGPYIPPKLRSREGYQGYYVYQLTGGKLLHHIVYLWPYLCQAKRMQYFTKMTGIENKV